MSDQDDYILRLQAEADEARQAQAEAEKAAQQARGERDAVLRQVAAQEARIARAAEPKRQFSLAIPESVYALVENEAASRGVKPATIGRELIEQAFGIE